jgi:hypothetical protein
VRVSAKLLVRESKRSVSKIGSSLDFVLVRVNPGSMDSA